MKLRPNEAELDKLGDVFRKQWQEYYVPAPDKPVLWMGTMSMYAQAASRLQRYLRSKLISMHRFMGDRSQDSVNKAYSIGWYLQYPVSLGHVHITSADDVHAPLDFHPGFLDSCVIFAGSTFVLCSHLICRPEDMVLHKWGYKLSREFGRRLPSYRGEIASTHPAFAASSKAAAGARSGPVPVGAPDIEYSAEDEAALEAYIRRVVSTTWHSVSLLSRRSWPADALYYHTDSDCMMADRDLCDEEARGRWRSGLEAECIWHRRPKSRGYVLAAQ